ncbi:FA10 factor, partial [Psilopogon haemacephalus]|nr:FA10 factor [Psilopogon haemacephalus]
VLLSCCFPVSSVQFVFPVLMRKDEAHKVLKVHKRANYFLEEIRPGNLERECNEEKCSFEEAKEIFHAQEKTGSLDSPNDTVPCFFYLGLNPCGTNPCLNGGVCKIRHYNYFCICPPRFGGANCEKAPCVSIPEKSECWYQNGGCWQYCRDSSSAFHVVCSCAQDYILHEVGRRCLQADTLQLVQADLKAPLENNDSRITGGTLCHRGHCPWQVMLVLIRNSKDVGFCGGSLISSRWVVTAAHCLDLVRPHHVTVGEYSFWDFDKYQREFKEQKINVEQSWTHPHYDSNDYNSDIALLYLSSNVILNEYAIPICLPSPNLATLLSEEGRIGMVSGWGATHDRGSTLRFLMKVWLPIVSLETCQQATERLVTDNMFCAGYNTEVADACKGDSGGPFTVSYRNTWFLLGIVSWGEGCGEKGKYGVYTRVSNYIPWIKEIVE